jgi:hypothetical protein
MPPVVLAPPFVVVLGDGSLAGLTGVPPVLEAETVCTPSQSVAANAATNNTARAAAGRPRKLCLSWSAGGVS